MSCKTYIIEHCEIKGNTFEMAVFNFGSRDISGDSFTAKVYNSRGMFLQNLIPNKIDEVVYYPISELEGKEAGGYRIDYWAVFAGIGTELIAKETFKIIDPKNVSDAYNGSRNAVDYSLVIGGTVVNFGISSSIVNIYAGGEPGKDFTFDDFTPEQLELLKGDPLTFADLTPEQINSLRGNPFTFADFTPEQKESLKVKGAPFTFQDLTPAQVVLMKGTDGVNGTNGTNGTNGKNAFELWQVDNPAGTYNDYKNDIVRKKSISLLENFTNSTNIYAEVSDLNFTLEAGKNYRVKLLGTVLSIATTTGVNVSFTFDGNIIANGFLECSLTHIAAATTSRTTVYNIDASTATTGSNLLTTGVGAINMPVMLNSEMVIRCIDSGTFKTWFASEISGSQAQINIGTTFIIEEI